jgi:hypothetical protein
MTQHSTQPGYYPDPAGGPTPRWFNGTTWTEQYAPPPEPARFTIHYGFALLAVLSLLATLFFGIAMIAGNANDTDKDTASIGITMGVLWLGWGGMWTLIWVAFAVNHTIKVRRGR